MRLPIRIIRAIGHYGRILLGMVFKKDHPLYHQIELVEALIAGGYKYSRLNFPATRDSRQRVTVTGESACIGCHGSPARPIWGTYALWPGAIGGDDDMFSAAKWGTLRERQHLTKVYDKIKEGGRYGLFRPEETWRLELPGTSDNVEFTGEIMQLELPPDDD